MGIYGPKADEIRAQIAERERDVERDLLNGTGTKAARQVVRDLKATLITAEAEEGAKSQEAMSAHQAQIYDAASLIMAEMAVRLALAVDPFGGDPPTVSSDAEGACRELVAARAMIADAQKPLDKALATVAKHRGQLFERQGEREAIKARRGNGTEVYTDKEAVGLADADIELLEEKVAEAEVTVADKRKPFESAKRMEAIAMAELARLESNLLTGWVVARVRSHWDGMISGLKWLQQNDPSGRSAAEWMRDDRQLIKDFQRVLRPAAIQARIF